MESNELADKLGKLIGKVRRNKDLSRAELAEMSGISAITIRRVEGGTAVGLGLDNLLSLANALEVSMADLLYEVERGETALRKINSRWESLVDRVDKFPLNQKDWIAQVIQNMLERPMMT